MKIIKVCKISLLLFCLISILNSCKKDSKEEETNPPQVPSITTLATDNITQTVASSGGNVSSDGGASVTARGVCWSTTSSPTISSSKTSDGTGTGSFTSSLTGLTANTTYYVRAYATNSAGTGYGNEVSFTTLPIGSIVAPVITTSQIGSITQNSASGGGNVTSDGGATVTARGVCWSTTSSPTISNSKTSDGTGTGSFTSSLTGLTANTTYYVRAFATNSAGTSYGSEVSFKTLQPSSSTVTDVDGNVYNTVVIGTQEWMTENLKTTKYSNSDAIPNKTDNTQWNALISGAYSDYENITTNSATYGKLYNWYAVDDSRNVCPTGWHVPTDDDFNTLSDYLGGATLAGGKLKEIGTTHWNTPNTGADNNSGFTALPAGYRFGTGTFIDIGNSGWLWSATEKDVTYAFYRSLSKNDASFSRANYGKKGGLSVRCVKN